MAKVLITKSKLDSLAQHINAKAGTSGTKTIAQMQETVDGITEMHPQAKSVTPTFSSQQVTPDEGYNCLSQVQVAPIPVRQVENDAGGITLIIGEA